MLKENKTLLKRPERNIGNLISRFRIKSIFILIAVLLPTFSACNNNFTKEKENEIAEKSKKFRENSRKRIKMAEKYTKKKKDIAKTYFKLQKIWEKDPIKAINFSIEVPKNWSINQTSNLRSIEFRTPEIEKIEPWSDISIFMVLSCPFEIKDRKLCIGACAKRYFGEDAFKTIKIEKTSENKIWYIRESDVKGKKRINYRYYMTDPGYKHIVVANIVLFDENQKFSDQYIKACNSLKFAN